VGVKRGAAYFGTIQNVLDRDGFEWLFVHQGDEGIAKNISRGANTPVHSLSVRRDNFFPCRCVKCVLLHG
jgi:hypothetical protein